MTPLLTWDWPVTPIVIVVIAVSAVVLRWLVIRAITSGVSASLKHARARDASSYTDRILAAAAGLDHARHEARTRTIGTVLRSVTTVAIFAVAILTILDTLGVPLGAILASAGIGGIAFGFGAQSLVKDYLSGIFMILEDQYGVGDLIDTGEVTGTVEDVGLRVTRVRDGSGQIWYVRNGEITRVGNRSQGWSMATVDLPVAYDEDAPRVLAVLKEAMADLAADPRWESVLLDPPVIAGVDRIAGGAMTIRIFAKCAPNQDAPVQRDILERGQQALRAAGIRGPVLGPETVNPDALG